MNNTLTLKHQPVGELSNIIVRFIQFKRSLGYSYKIEEGVLHRFSVFSLYFKINGYEVPLQLIEGWLKLRKNEKPQTQKTRGQCVLHMLNFASKCGYIVHFPVMMMRIHVPKYVPYIFTEKELEQFCQA